MIRDKCAEIFYFAVVYYLNNVVEQIKSNESKLTEVLVEISEPLTIVADTYEIPEACLKILDRCHDGEESSTDSSPRKDIALWQLLERKKMLWSVN